MNVRVVRSARRHGLSAGRIREAFATAVLVHTEGDAATYTGTNSRGLEIEMVIVPDDRRSGGFAVIHAMPRRWSRRW